MNQRNHAEVLLMNHDHTEHELTHTLNAHARTHTHTHTHCVFTEGATRLIIPPVFPGDYANEGAVKGREDLKLI